MRVFPRFTFHRVMNRVGCKWIKITKSGRLRRRRRFNRKGAEIAKGCGGYECNVLGRETWMAYDFGNSSLLNLRLYLVMRVSAGQTSRPIEVALLFLAVFAPLRFNSCFVLEGSSARCQRSLKLWSFGFDDFGEAPEGVVTVLVVDAVEDALVELAVGTPDVVAVGDGSAFFVGGDDGFRVAIRVGFVADDPVVEESLLREPEGGLVVVIPDFRDLVNGDLGIAVDEVVLVVGGLEVGGGGVG